MFKRLYLQTLLPVLIACNSFLVNASTIFLADSNDQDSLRYFNENDKKTYYIDARSNPDRVCMHLGQIKAIDYTTGGLPTTKFFKNKTLALVNPKGSAKFFKVGQSSAVIYTSIRCMDWDYVDMSTYRQILVEHFQNNGYEPPYEFASQLSVREENYKISFKFFQDFTKHGYYGKNTDKNKKFKLVGLSASVLNNWNEWHFEHATSLMQQGRFLDPTNILKIN